MKRTAAVLAACLLAAATTRGAQGDEAGWVRAEARLMHVLIGLTAAALAGTLALGARARRTARQAADSAAALTREIEQSRSVKRELEKNQERIRAILNATVDAIITIDAKGVIQSCNPAAERMFGYTAEELVGSNVSLLMPSPYREEHDHYIARYLRTGQSRIIGTGREVIAMRKDGARIPIDLAVSDVTLHGEHLFTGVMRDIRDRKRLEAGLVAAGEKARQTIGRELHDALGQQLTGISLLAKTLARQLAAGGNPLSEDAATVVDLSRQALDQVRVLSHGLYPVDLQRMGIEGALQELAETARRFFRVECVFEMDEGEWTLPEDTALHLYRIAQEATHNAVRHGKATILSLSLRRGIDHLELKIEDNGVGLPPQPPDRQGLGLSIMAYRAALLGGTLDLCPAQQGGLAVICRMPWEAPDRSQA